MKHVLFFFLVLVFALQLSSANARCTEPASFLSDSSAEITSRYINFLICLHNEQQESIRLLHAEITNLQSEIVRVQEVHSIQMQKLIQAIEERLQSN